MHVHSHMPTLQPNIAPRPMKREPPSEEAYAIRGVFEQAGQRQKNPQQQRPGDPTPAEAFDAAAPEDPTRPQETAETSQLWSLLGSVVASPARREPEAPAPELSLDALLAQVVKPA
ncbi:hypothetical protein [Beijerinckia sp. L45]|uniref:hypothetical protein n=1 Tax=Beijerinckia sp. L45 TaxID=1641855 RepID=UPI00131BDF54|nr:hypothetical protein [Beijerinckia sp. L45]